MPTYYFSKKQLQYFKDGTTSDTYNLDVEKPGQDMNICSTVLLPLMASWWPCWYDLVLTYFHMWIVQTIQIKQTLNNF